MNRSPCYQQYVENFNTNEEDDHDSHMEPFSQHQNYQQNQQQTNQQQTNQQLNQRQPQQKKQQPNQQQINQQQDHQKNQQQKQLIETFVSSSQRLSQNYVKLQQQLVENFLNGATGADCKQKSDCTNDCYNGKCT
jgi:hypothetical protein